jgi:pyrimidine deaminase RibD-like protein
MKDAYCLRRAISIASKTNTSILGAWVGAVIVLDGEIISEGCKEFASVFYGDNTYKHPVLHAERVAIEKVRGREGSVKGSTIYSTLEPCVDCEESFDSDLCSCSELIYESGIVRVVTGKIDRNLEINGAGLEYLQERGVEVVYIGGFEYMIDTLVRRTAGSPRRKLNGNGNGNGKDRRHPITFSHMAERDNFLRMGLRQNESMRREMRRDYQFCRH